MKYKLKTLIADYSDTQRRLICHLVENHKDLTFVAASSNAGETTSLLNKTEPDLLLLDIEMPNLNGFELLERIGPRTQVILITSAPTYALEAFEYGVTDYLLKPVRIARFTKAINKVLMNYVPKPYVKQETPFLSVKSEQEIKKVSMSDIMWIEALGDYVKIVTRSERILVLSTLKAIEDELPDTTFLRIHRSYIVNLNKVDNFSSTSVEVRGREIPMSRKRKSLLEEILAPVIL